MSKFFNPDVTKADFVVQTVVVAAFVFGVVMTVRSFAAGDTQGGFAVLITTVAAGGVVARGWKYMVKR